MDMNKNLGLAALAAGLVCGAAGQLLAVSPSNHAGFEMSALARVSIQEPPAAIITPLDMKDAVAFVRAPRAEKSQPKSKSASGIVVSIGSADLERTSLGMNLAPGEPLSSTCGEEF